MSNAYAGIVHAQESRDAQLQVVDTLAPSLSLRDATRLAEKLTVKRVSGFKILVVEDEPTIAQTLRYNLEHAGYAVCEAGDGRTAIDVAFAEKPHLILMDVMLPVLILFFFFYLIRTKMN
ncbi:MAG: response regulator, partial [Candidatus Eremiobacteraeota bacterium]|nr:response regulator [Candidatus Eremiobacteraeota bacterium]